MKYTPQEQKIADIAEPVIRDLGYALVCVSLKNEEEGLILLVMAEDPKTRRLSIDACAKISRELGTVLDVEDLIKGRYRLEISSPGMDRPLVKEQDFIDFTGYEAKIDIDPPLETGQKHFRGRIESFEDQIVRLNTGEEELVSLPYTTIRKAKLVLTDEMIKKALSGS